MQLRLPVVTASCGSCSSHCCNIIVSCRRELVSILLKDPDHRLRVCHLEALLQNQFGNWGYPSGLLQGALKDTSCSRILYTDWSIQCDWDWRIVHLDVMELQRAVAQAHQIVAKPPSTAEAAACPHSTSNGLPAAKTPSVQNSALMAAIKATWPNYEVRTYTTDHMYILHHRHHAT